MLLIPLRSHKNTTQTQWDCLTAACNNVRLTHPDRKPLRPCLDRKSSPHYGNLYSTLHQPPPVEPPSYTDIPSRPAPSPAPPSTSPSTPSTHSKPASNPPPASKPQAGSAASTRASAPHSSAPRPAPRSSSSPTSLLRPSSAAAETHPRRCDAGTGARG